MKQLLSSINPGESKRISGSREEREAVYITNERAEVLGYQKIKGTGTIMMRSSISQYVSYSHIPNKTYTARAWQKVFDIIL